ncbi:MAG: sugar ABC transporter substrate-binding protein, partial [Propionicimonas sp.]|nr:sugar ABC transporter substrate-binding protein [Propionicimonas sp.]
MNEAEQKIIDAFTKENPGITVKMEKVAFADYDTKLTTQLRAGTGPDVFRVNHPNVQLWAGAGYLADLTNAMKEVDTKTFVPGLLAIGQMNGTYYALPIDTGNRALWYNPKLLKSVGVDKAPSTWADLLDTVSKFKDDKDVYGYCFLTNSDYAMAYETVGPYMAAAGGVILNDASPAQAVAATDAATVSAVKLLQDIAKTGEIPPGSANMDGDTRAALFAGGQCALMIGGTWERPTIEKDNPDAVFGEDYAVAVVPTPEAGQKSATTGGGWMLGVNAKSPQADAAAKFFSFFTKSESLKML